MSQVKAPLLSLPLAACTSEQLANLGLGGYRIHASNGADVVFILEPAIDVTPPYVHAALMAAHAEARAEKDQPLDKHELA